jgi:16S rRNA (cytosine1402-N4)-methyltransferase
MSSLAPTRHVSVLLHEVVHYLTPSLNAAKAVQQGKVFFDGTLGGGGHFGILLDHLQAGDVAIGVDKDAEALERMQTRINTHALAQHHTHSSRPRTVLMCGSYADVPEHMAQAAVDHIDMALLDLGLSSDQLEQSGRGFSFMRDEPLRMTMKAHPHELDVTAADIVNTWSETALADLIFTYGEDTHARRIARAIAEQRARGLIDTTGALVAIIEKVLGKGRGFHPATKTFQALRIAVNSELDDVRRGIPALIAALAPGGRLAVITFHSLEDRLVKIAFRQAADAGEGTLVTKKPLVPSDEERVRNPRARSAKLRVFEKL